MQQISVVIPVYRAENTLRELHTRIVEAIEPMTSDFEIIMVEDCGGDGSWEVIDEIASADPRVRGIRLSRNFGQHAATICGFANAQGHWIITMDDDLEHRPEYIPELYRKAQDGYDLVYGVYPVRTHIWWRNLASNIARRLFKVAIPNLNDQYTLPIRLTPMTATCRELPLSRVKLGIGWSRGVARDAEQ